MQLTLLPSFYNVTVLLSGVKSPIYRKDIPDQPDLIEPFAAEVRIAPTLPAMGAMSLPQPRAQCLHRHTSCCS